MKHVIFEMKMETKLIINVLIVNMVMKNMIIIVLFVIWIKNIGIMPNLNYNECLYNNNECPINYRVLIENSNQCTNNCPFCYYLNGN